MADRGALDAAITALGTETANLIALANTLIAKGQNAASIDFSPEIDQLSQIGKNIDSAIAAANTAAASPEVPQTPPTTGSGSTQPPTTSSQGTTSTPPQA